MAGSFIALAPGRRAIKIGLPLVLAALTLIAVKSAAEAYFVPQLPHTFWGTLTLDGAPASDGTQIRFLVNGAQVITTATFTPDSMRGAYAATVPTAETCPPASPYCDAPGGLTGDLVSVGVTGYEIAQTARFVSGQVQQLDLSNSAFTYTFTTVITGDTDVVLHTNDGSNSLIINANNVDLNSTAVVIRANQDCTAVAGETILRCFDITPSPSATPNATLTFYFYISQIPPAQTCASLNVYHWTGGDWSAPLTLDTSYGTAGRDCTGPLRSIRVQNVSSFSQFVIKAGTPTAIGLREFTASSAKHLAADIWVKWGWLVGALSLGVGWLIFRARRKRFPEK